MKKLILIMFLMAGIGVGAQAQAKKNQGQLPKHLAKQLNLSADQQAKVNTIMQAKAAKLDSVDAKSAELGKKGVHKQKKQINTAAEDQLNSVFNDDQKKAYAAFKTSQAEKMRAKKQGAAAAPATPATPSSN